MQGQEIAMMDRSVSNHKTLIPNEHKHYRIPDANAVLDFDTLYPDIGDVDGENNLDASMV